MQIFDKFIPFSSAARLHLCEPLLVAPPEEGAREQGGDYKAAVCNEYQFKKKEDRTYTTRGGCADCASTEAPIWTGRSAGQWRYRSTTR